MKIDILIRNKGMYYTERSFEYIFVPILLYFACLNRVQTF